MNYAYFGAYTWEPEDTILYGKCYDQPVLEIKDSTLFKGSRAYCYSLIRPAAGNSADIMQEAIQRDLANCFGFKASMEARKCPYWKIIARPGAMEKLKTKGGKTFEHELSLKVGWTMSNRPMSYIIGCIRANDPGRDRLVNIYLDETGITDNIDITLDCIMNDLNDLRRALRANGLDIVKGEKEMKVVIIRDANGD